MFRYQRTCRPLVNVDEDEKSKMMYPESKKRKPKQSFVGVEKGEEHEMLNQ